MKITIEDMTQREAEDLFGSPMEADKLRYQVSDLTAKLQEANRVSALAKLATPDGQKSWSKLASAFADASAGRKINAIKSIRELLGCGLKEAKDIVEGTFYSNPY
jgi:ribosomal protein L7/L12